MENIISYRGFQLRVSFDIPNEQIVGEVILDENFKDLKFLRGKDSFYDLIVEYGMNYKIRIMTKLDYIWFQVIKAVLPLIWKFLHKDSQREILQELWAWQEVLRFRRQDYFQQVEIGNLLYKLSNK